MQRRLDWDDLLTVLALVTTIALVAQTTWAIVCEGQDNHEAEVSTSKFGLVAGVGTSSLRPPWFDY